MANLQEIRRELARFLAHEVTLDAFNEWLSRNTWNIQRESSPVKDLVGAIELMLVEFSNGHRSETEVREHLTALLPNREFTIVFDNSLRALPTATTSSSTSYQTVALGS
jgi:hypothetical protein